MSKRILTAYFSASGETAKLAKTIADATGADLFEIRPERPYTSADLNWNDKKSRSSIEMNDAASRPTIANTVQDMEQYDVVFLGFPIWWYEAPHIIETFLESYNFSGKLVVPFATSGGSGMGKTDEILKSICPPDTQWRDSKRMSGSASRESVQMWIDSLNL